MGDQATGFTFGTTLADPDIGSSLHKRYDVLANSGSGSDRVAFMDNQRVEVETLS